MRDDLTLLPGRKEFFNNLEGYLDSNDNRKEISSLLVINIAKLKLINKAFGYDAGDKLLINVSKRIKKVCRDSDMLGRIGHNCFALLLGSIMNKGHASLAVNKLLAVLHEPFIIDKQTININVTIGAALYPYDTNKSETLIKNAEGALEQAKLSGVKSQFYTVESRSVRFDHLTLELELVKAINGGDLIVHFQPQIDMLTRKLCGAEALLRWTHPLLGQIRPGVFIPLAEQTGLIDSLTTWSLNATLRQYGAYQEQYGCFDISFNLSAKLLADQDIVELIQSALAIWGVAPENLILEITESAMMDHPMKSLATLRRISDAGIKISIDDFGTGYSSLSYLKQLPANELKIDKSFVIGMTEDADNRKIVQSIIDLAHTFDLKVVSEGIENEKVYNALTQMGSDIGQGYFIGKAVSMDDFIKWRHMFLRVDECPLLQTRDEQKISKKG